MVRDADRSWRERSSLGTAPGDPAHETRGDVATREKPGTPGAVPNEERSRHERSASLTIANAIIRNAITFGNQETQLFYCVFKTRPTVYHLGRGSIVRCAQFLYDYLGVLKCHVGGNV